MHPCTHTQMELADCPAVLHLALATDEETGQHLAATRARLQAAVSHADKLHEVSQAASSSEPCRQVA